jgi:hypothetical protein
VAAPFAFAGPSVDAAPVATPAARSGRRALWPAAVPLPDPAPGTTSATRSVRRLFRPDAAAERLGAGLAGWSAAPVLAERSPADLAVRPSRLGTPPVSAMAPSSVLSRASSGTRDPGIWIME